MKVLALIVLLAVGAYGRGVRRAAPADPMPLPDVDQTFTGENGVNGHFRANSLVVTGLSTVTYSLDITDVNVHAKLDVPNVKLDGNLDAAITVDQPEARLGANGAFFLQHQNFNLDLNVQVNVHNNNFEGNFEVTDVELVIQFGTFLASLTDAYFNDITDPNWDEISAKYTEAATAFLADNKEKIEQVLKFGANLLTAKCNYYELTQGNFECIESPIPIPSIEKIIVMIIQYISQ